MRNPGCPGGLELVEIAAAERLGLKVIALDVTDPARCEAVVREIAAEDGPIEVHRTFNSCECSLKLERDRFLSQGQFIVSRCLQREFALRSGGLGNCG